MIVRKDSPLLFPIIMAKKAEVDIRDMPGATWRDVVAAVLEQCREPVTLTFLYEKIEPHKKHRQISGGKKKSAKRFGSILHTSFMMAGECGL
ncbi:hypothetical protein LC724_18225 [Blautia sp. RD014234]|nr:hypothetical protein [Blautia parvula]